MTKKCIAARRRYRQKKRGGGLIKRLLAPRMKRAKTPGTKEYKATHRKRGGFFWRGPGGHGPTKRKRGGAFGKKFTGSMLANKSWFAQDRWM